MPTPHLRAQSDDYAKTVLMPGDPLRARYIAENFFDDPRLVTDVRAMEGYTGTWKGTPISVQGSGMGIPSIQIYATELYTQYGVENIIRIGSCGALQDNIDLGDVIIAVGAGTDSNVNRMRLGGWDLAAVADYGLLRAVVDSAEARGQKPHVGSIFTSDYFYSPQEGVFDLLEKYGILAVEMEAAGLYGLAAELGKKALAVCTVSDQIKREQAMSVEDRQTSFNDMITMVLDAVLTLP